MHPSAMADWLQHRIRIHIAFARTTELKAPSWSSRGNSFSEINPFPSWLNAAVRVHQLRPNRDAINRKILISHSHTVSRQPVLSGIELRKNSLMVCQNKDRSSPASDRVQRCAGWCDRRRCVVVTVEKSPTWGAVKSKIAPTSGGVLRNFESKKKVKI